MGSHEERLASDQSAWNAAVRLGTFSYRALAAEASIPIERATRLTRGWVRLGSVAGLGKGGGKKLMFRVTAESFPASSISRRQSPDGNMWLAMRKLGGAFTPTDIAAHATTEAVSVSREDAQAFCQMLVRAGYLRVQRKAAPPRREAVYRLIKNTGPMPPRERRVRAIWDPNLAEFTHMPEASL
ncbi:hypothetical protein [Pararhodobacter sp.]|uniref:hypothetical protein n=1 Tax=Pararhodobacter sp. TaxID=2127056 RepID=UPI002B0027FE|nr:hypothetical protein [Pararhodobacter sp.]